MTALSVSQATQALTITRAIKSRWHSANRKEDDNYEMAPAPSERRVRSLIPWRRATDAMVEAELRHRVALAEEQLAELKTVLGDMSTARRLAGDGAGPHTTGFAWERPVVMGSVNRMTG